MLLEFTEQLLGHNISVLCTNSFFTQIPKCKAMPSSLLYAAAKQLSPEHSAQLKCSCSLGANQVHARQTPHSVKPVPRPAVVRDLCAELHSAWAHPTTTPSQERRGSPGTHQLLGPHVVEDPLCILAVVPALHDCQEQLWSVVLKGRKNTTSHCMESKAERIQLRLLHTHCPEGLEILGFCEYKHQARQSHPAGATAGLLQPQRAKHSLSSNYLAILLRWVFYCLFIF